MSMKDIRQKINSINNSQKITKAMEKVAASKMQKSQRRMQAALPYADKIRNVIEHIACSHAEYQHPYMKTRPIKRIGYIIISTDRGLCGGLNTNLFKRVLQKIRSDQEETGAAIRLCLIGAKAMAFFKRVGGQVLAHQRNLGDAPHPDDLIGVVKVMLDAYLSGEIDALYLCSNQFVNSMRQNPRVEQILPFVSSESEAVQGYWDYIYEPNDAALLLDRFFQRFFESTAFRAVVENIACENASRMVAMKTANENANDLRNKLQMEYNKVRQASITRELSEIVAGASVI